MSLKISPVFLLKSRGFFIPKHFLIEPTKYFIFILFGKKIEFV